MTTLGERARSLVVVSLALSALACGEENGTGPGGLPASVAIDPVELSLRIGEAKPVAARYLNDGGGAVEPPADWTRAWSSSDTTVLTVDDEGTVRGRRPGTAQVTLRAGSPGGPELESEALVQVLEPVAQQASDRASGATVGPEGGTVTAEGADGTRYVLTVPAAALVEPVEIELTPLTGIDHLPLGGALSGAVDFSPDGLRFRRPAELRVIAPGPVEAAGLAGFGFRDGDFRLAPFRVSGDTIVTMVGHFSGAGAAGGSGEEVAALASLPAGTPEEAALQAIARHNWDAMMAGEDPDPATLAGFLETWYEQALEPALEDAVSDSTKLEAAVSEFTRWEAQRSLWTDGWLEAESAAAHELVIEAIGAQIERLDAYCAAQNDVGPVAAILSWAGMAEALGVATPENGLAIDTVVQNLCLQVRIVETIFPDTIRAFATETLEVRAGISIGGRAPVFDTQLDMTLDDDGTASVSPPSGVTDGEGWFRAQVSLVEGSSRARISVEAAYPGIPQVDATEEVTAWGEVSLSLAGRLSGTTGADTKELELEPGDQAQLTIVASQGQGGYAGRPVTLSVDGGGTLSATEVQVDPTDGTRTVYYTVPDGAGEATIRATLVDGGMILRDSVSVRWESFQPVDLELDFSNGEANPTVAGPVLRTGMDYLVTVSGTYSIWTSEWENGICRGAPDAGVGGPTGFDAEALFAVPVGSTLCQEQYGCCPRHSDQFAVSVDGGADFDHHHPGAAPDYVPVEEPLALANASRTYTYRLTGQGQAVLFRIRESGNRGDDYGILEIHIERAPPMEEEPVAAPGASPPAPLSGASPPAG